MKKNKTNRLLKWFLGITFLAILASAYLSVLFYNHDLAAPCTINYFWDCGAVSNSPYAILLGIPVAIWGLITYLFLFFTGFALLYKFNKCLFQLIFAITAFGVVFSLYLTYAELFLIHAICLFCLAQQILIIINLILLSRIYQVYRSQSK